MRKLFWSGVPMLQIGIYLAAGILLAPYFHFVGNNLFIALSILLGCYLTFMRTSQLARMCPIISAFFFVVAGMLLGTWHKPEAKDATIKTVVNIEGIISGKVIKSRRYDTFGKVVLRLDSLKADKLYTFQNTKLALYCSDSILLPTQDSYLQTRTRLKVLQRPIHEHQFDNRTYNLRKNIVLKGALKEYTILRTPPYQTQIIHKVQQHFDKLLDEHIEQKPIRSIFSSLVLGNRDTLDEDIYTKFQQAGGLHLLAISGLHIGLVIKFIEWLLQFFFPFKQWERWSSLFAIGVGWVYIILTGMPISAVRAGFIFSILVIGKLFNRNHQAMNSVAAAFTLFIIFNPSLLYDIGFQLSFAAVSGLCLAMPRVNDYTRYWPKWKKTIAQLIALSCIAQISVAPFILYHFHQFQTYALISGTIGVVVTGWCLHAGMLFLIFGSFSEWMASLLGSICEGLFECLYWLISHTASLPYALCQGIHISEIVFIILIITIFILFLALAMRQYNYIWLALFTSMAMSVVISIEDKALHDGLYLYPLNSGIGIDKVENGQVVRLQNRASLFEIETKMNSFIQAKKAYSLQTLTLAKDQIGWQSQESIVFYQDDLTLHQKKMDYLVLPPWSSTWNLSDFLNKNKVSMLVFNSETLHPKALEHIYETSPKISKLDLKGTLQYLPLKNDALNAGRN